MGEESWSIDYLTIRGDPERQDVWDNVDETLRTVFVREDETRLGCSATCIDSGYLPSRVFRFTAPRRKRQIHATKGKSNYTGPLAGKPSWQGNKKARALQYPINTNEAKQILFTRLEKNDTPGPGYCHFPVHYTKDYFDMLTAEEKRTKFTRGVKKATWVKIRERNEAIDCRTGAMAALVIVNPKF